MSGPSVVTHSTVRPTWPAAHRAEVGAAVFDMDGVLFDTERVYRDSTLGALEDIGYTADLDLCRRLVGQPNDECDRIIRGWFGPTFPFEQLDAAYQRRKRRALGRGPLVKPGVLAALRTLRSADVPIGLTTGSGTDVARCYLDMTGLSAFFDVVVGSDQVANGKPAPDVYWVAASELSSDPHNCIAFEDSAPGIRSAASAGVAVVYVQDLYLVEPGAWSLCSTQLGTLSEFNLSEVLASKRLRRAATAPELRPA